MVFPQKMRHFFPLLLGFAILLGTVGGSGCATRDQDYLVEYDDVYATPDDYVAEKAAIEAAKADGSYESGKRPPRERPKLNPRVKKALLWTGGALLEMGLNIALALLFYG